MGDTTVSCDQPTKGRIKRLTGEMSEVVTEHAASLAEGSNEEMDMDEFDENLVTVGQKEIIDLATRILDRQENKKELMRQYAYGDLA